MVFFYHKEQKMRLTDDRYAGERSQFELALLPPGSPYLPAELNQPNPVWARRSRFEIHGKAVLVSEAFLDTFRPWEGVLPVHRSQRGKVSTAFRRATQ